MSSKSLPSNLPITSFTALIDITEDEQIKEIEEYLDTKGIVVEANETEEQLPRLFRAIEKCSQIFCDPSVQSQELEGLVYCLASLLHIAEDDSSAQILDSICQLVVKGANNDNAHHRLKLLSLLFCQFEPKDATALIVLKHQLKFATEYKIRNSLTVTAKKLKRWMDNWKLSTADRGSVWMLFWNAIKSSADKCCIDTLIEVLSLPGYEESSELATELIVLALNDPTYYYFNNILQLKSVKNLQSESKIVYELLQLFVEGKISLFKRFCESHRPLMDSELGLNYSICERKMQLLTLVSLSVDSKEVLFSTLTEELQLDIPEIEQLIIDAICRKLLKARIDHVNKKLIIMSCIYRTFDQEEWKVIYDRMSQWKDNISALRANLKTLNAIPS